MVDSALNPTRNEAFVAALLALLSIAAAVVPLVAMLVLCWWLDRQDREPFWLVLLTFFWGAFGATLLSLNGNFLGALLLRRLLGPEQAEDLVAVLVAPIVEEPSKALVLLVVWMSRHFDNSVDGFLYGAAAGLGFAMTENLLYYLQVASLASWDPMEGTLAWARTVGLRTAYSAVLHATASAIVGASFGMSRYRGPLVRALALPGGLALAMLMHATFNGLVTASARDLGPAFVSWLNYLLMPAEALAVLCAFQLALWLERRRLRHHLRLEAAAGTLPAAHIDPLLSPWRRRMAGWCAPQVDRAAYARAAMTLGFRLRQAHLRPEESFLHEDASRLRQELRALLRAGDAPRRAQGSGFIA